MNQRQAEANKAVAAFIESLKDCGYSPLQVRRAFEPYWKSLTPNSVLRDRIALEAANCDRSGGLSPESRELLARIEREEAREAA